jgi:hypothetical protein
VDVALTKPAGAYTEDPKIKITPTRKVLSVFVPESIVINPTRNASIQDVPESTSNILPFTFRPRFESPTLRLLRYELSRTLAYFSPIVAHGSSGLPDNITKTGSTYFQELIKSTLTLGKAHPGFKNEVIAYVSSLQDPGTIGLVTTQQVDYTRVGILNFDTLVQAGEITPPPNQISSLSTAYDDLAAQSDEKTTNISLGNYTTLKYSQIVDRQNNQTTDGLLKKDFRELLNLPDTKYIGKMKPSKWIEKNGTIEDVSPLSSANSPEKDLIKLQIAYTPPGNKRVPLNFRAYLTAFSDSFTSEFGSKTFFNRGTDVRTFQKAGREIAIGFKVPCLTSTDANSVYGRLQQLCQLACIPSQIQGVAANPPAFDITIGRWAVKLPVIISSIKLDLQTADYTWDIAQQLPHIIDVSLSCTVDVAKGTAGFAIINNG